MRPPHISKAKVVGVKSATRALEVLELFSNIRKPLSATEVGFILGYPKSSTNVLLKCLTDIGYLNLNLDSMRYFPTLRATSLGEWVPAALYGPGDAGSMLQEVHDLTGETVTLSMRTGMSMRFIRVLPGKYFISLRIEEGQLAPLLGSSVGAAYLSKCNLNEITLLAESARAMAKSRKDRENIEQTLDVATKTRKTGFGVIYGSMFPDVGAIAMPLPFASDGNILVICVGGLEDRIRMNERAITLVMKNAITKHLMQSESI